MSTTVSRDIPIQAPPIVKRYIDADLDEVFKLLDAAESAQRVGMFEDSVGLLENAHETILHLGKLADLQSAHHGPPQAENDDRDDIQLSKQDEMLQTISMMLTAYHYDPRWAHHTSLTHDIVSGDSYEKGDPIMPSDSTATAGSQPTPLRYPTPDNSLYHVTHSMHAGADADVEEDIVVHAGAGLSGTGMSEPAVLRFDEYAIWEEPDPSHAHTQHQMQQQHQIPPQYHGHSAIAEPAMGATPFEEVPAASTGLKKARTKWTEDELQLFDEGCLLYGPHKPKLIAQHMGTRNSEQVREHIKTLKRKSKGT